MTQPKVCAWREVHDDFLPLWDKETLDNISQTCFSSLSIVSKLSDLCFSVTVSFFRTGSNLEKCCGFLKPLLLLFRRIPGDKDT